MDHRTRLFPLFLLFSCAASSASNDPGSDGGSSPQSQSDGPGGSSGGSSGSPPVVGGAVLSPGDGGAAGSSGDPNSQHDDAPYCNPVSGYSADLCADFLFVCNPASYRPSSGCSTVDAYNSEYSCCPEACAIYAYSQGFCDDGEQVYDCHAEGLETYLGQHPECRQAAEANAICCPKQ